MCVEAAMVDVEGELACERWRGGDRAQADQADLGSGFGLSPRRACDARRDELDCT